MSEQNGIQASTKRSRSRQTNKQNGTRAPALQHPANDDKEAWKAYWKAQGRPWRKEPEIDFERQAYLTERRAILPDIERGIYPFGDVKLSRADVEWLLVTHENGRGPVNWSDERQQERLGLDLRRANLCDADLSHLPLARMRGGLTYDESISATVNQNKLAAIHLEGAFLRGTHLEGAHLRYAHLERANFGFTFLERTHLRGAFLIGADFREAYIGRARLENTVLSDEKHIGPYLVDAKWGDTNLAVIKWSQIAMFAEEFEALKKKHNGKVKDQAVRLGEYEIAVRANRQLAIALQAQGLNEDAARFAYRAQMLQRKVIWYQIFSKRKQQVEENQGSITLKERLVDAGQRVLKFGSYVFWWFLDLLAGYGYRPGRTLGWYLFVIWGFAIAYSVLRHLPLLPDTLVFSIMSFHGRGFFPSLSGETALHNPLVVLAAAEAIIGLLIEISFIATFTQRFFGK